MRFKIILAAVACFVVGLGVAGASARPNFSGTWEMDKTRSYGIPPDMSQTMTVLQTDDKVTVEIKVVTARGERVINDVYTLDGKEVDFTPQGPTGPTGKGKRVAKWLPAGNGIVINEESTVDSPNGPVTTQQVRKWTMSADGSRLTIELHIDGPRGSGEMTRTFVKKTT